MTEPATNSQINNLRDNDVTVYPGRLIARIDLLKDDLKAADDLLRDILAEGTPERVLAAIDTFRARIRDNGNLI